MGENIRDRILRIKLHTGIHLIHVEILVGQTLHRPWVFVWDNLFVSPALRQCLNYGQIWRRGTGTNGMEKTNCIYSCFWCEPRPQHPGNPNQRFFIPLPSFYNRNFISMPHGSPGSMLLHLFSLAPLRGLNGRTSSCRSVCHRPS